jgi:uncharacterized membrane protein YheB (UPF0754 family)
MNKLLFIIPFISAFIGWFTISIFMKMLFHPRIPKKILGFTIHGIFPKRQKQFAQQLGKLVSKELFSFKEIEDKITSPDSLKKIMPIVDEHIDNFLRNKLAATMPMLSMFIGDKTIAQLKDVFMIELQELFPQLMKNYMTNLQQDLNFEKIVTEKVSHFSLIKLEQTFNDTVGKELRRLKILASILGFIIGWLQVLITMF